MKILFVASEAAPFVRTGGLGDVAGALPKAFNKLGHDARVIIPYYKEEIKDSFKSGMRFLGSTLCGSELAQTVCRGVRGGL